MVDKEDNDGIYNFCDFSGSSALMYNEDESRKTLKNKMKK